MYLSLQIPEEPQKSDRDVLHRLLTSLFILANKHCNYAPLPLKPSVILCKFYRRKTKKYIYKIVKAKVEK